METTTTTAATTTAAAAAAAAGEPTCMKGSPLAGTDRDKHRNL